MPSYLEMSMDAFARNQEKLRSQMREAFGGAPGFQMFEETARQNMALFEQAMKVFSPVGSIYQQAAHRAGSSSESEDIGALKAQLAALQRQLDKLEKK